MSELGNLLKKLRGKTTQATLAAESGLAPRSIQRLEDGEDVRLETLRQLRAHYRLVDSAWGELLAAWCRLKLGEDSVHVQITSRHRPVKGGENHQFEQFIERYRALPEKYQRELSLAAEREEVLRSLVPINQLVSKLKKPDGQ